MTGLLLATLLPAGFVSGWLLTARLLFARWRPFTEPLNCRGHYGQPSHDYMCYRREGALIDSAREAASYAVLTALGWPVVLLLLSVSALIMRNAPQRPEETAAKIARLERDLKLRGDTP